MPQSPPHKKYGVLAIGAGAAISVSFLFALQGTVARRNATEQDLRAQARIDHAQRIEDIRLCHFNRVQNHILIAQLEGALVRVRASIPSPDNPIRQQQISVLSDGIAQLKRLKC